MQAIVIKIKDKIYECQRLSAEDEFEVTSKLESLLFTALTSSIKNKEEANRKLTLSDVKSILKVVDLEDYKLISSKILDRGVFEKGNPTPVDLQHFQGRTGLFRSLIAQYCYEAFNDFFTGLQEDLKEMLAEKM